MSNQKNCECKTVLKKIKKIIEKYNCGCCTVQETPEPSVAEQPHNPDCQCDPCECENCECKPEEQIQEELTIVDEPIPIKKRAVLIGINYIGTNAELGGCINDVNNMKQVLIKNYGYKNDDITVITDNGKVKGNETKNNIKPTKHQILRHLQWLVNSQNLGFNQFYFHYSGHGSYIRDQNNDESDGRDECLVPVDYITADFIRDDEIKKILSGLLPTSKLTCVIDACHSATMLDSKYELDCKSVQLEQNQSDSDAYLYQNWSYAFEYKENHKYNDTNNIFSISGCRDNQTSADAWINNKYQGALSYHFMKTLELNKYNIKTKYLIKDIHCMLKLGQYDQKPVITSTQKIDIDAEFTL